MNPKPETVDELIDAAEKAAHAVGTIRSGFGERDRKTLRMDDVWDATERPLKDLQIALAKIRDEKSGFNPATESLEVLSMAGLCNNGANRTSGRLYHLVPTGSNVALCGARPGRRSAGWYTWDDNRPSEATCRNCITRKERYQQGK